MYNLTESKRKKQERNILLFYDYYINKIPFRELEEKYNLTGPGISKIIRQNRRLLAISIDDQIITPEEIRELRENVEIEPRRRLPKRNKKEAVPEKESQHENETPELGVLIPVTAPTPETIPTPEIKPEPEKQPIQELEIFSTEETPEEKKEESLPSLQPIGQIELVEVKKPLSKMTFRERLNLKYKK